jgi:hypothetical protein
LHLDIAGLLLLLLPGRDAEDGAHERPGEQRGPPPQGRDDAHRGSDGADTHGAVGGTLDAVEEEGAEGGQVVGKIAFNPGAQLSNGRQG